MKMKKLKKQLASVLVALSTIATQSASGDAPIIIGGDLQKDPVKTQPKKYDKNLALNVGLSFFGIALMAGVTYAICHSKQQQFVKLIAKSENLGDLFPWQGYSATFPKVSRTYTFLFFWKRLDVISKDQLDLNVLVVGESGVGKSRLCGSWFGPWGMDSRFTSCRGPAYESFRAFNEFANFTVYDMSGKGCDRTLVLRYFKHADIVFLVYNVNDRKSFDALDGWQAEVKKHNTKSLIFIIIGNKIGEGQEVSEDEAIAKAENLGCCAVYIGNSSNKTEDKAAEDFEKVWEA
jgi:hypothetical protein